LLFKNNKAIKTKVFFLFVFCAFMGPTDYGSHENNHTELQGHRNEPCVATVGGSLTKHLIGLRITKSVSGNSIRFCAISDY
jgi:hypothetical protein